MVLHCTTLFFRRLNSSLSPRNYLFSSLEKRSPKSNESRNIQQPTMDIKLCSIKSNSIREKNRTLETSGFGVVTIQEPKIDSGVLNAELFPPKLGYSIFRKDRVMGGGGVLLAVKSDLNPRPV